MARLKLAWWRNEVARRFGGRPQHPVALALAPGRAQLQPARGALPGGDRRHGDGPRRRTAISISRRSSATAIASPASSASCRRRSSATRIRPRAATRATSASRSSSPTSSATSARTRARGRIYLPQDELAALRRDGGRSSLARAASAPAFARADGRRRSRARERWYARALGRAAGARPPRAAARAHHGGDLPRAAARDRARRLPRARPPHRA